jgi:hypothetical protein
MRHTSNLTPHHRSLKSSATRERGRLHRVA